MREPMPVADLQPPSFWFTMSGFLCKVAKAEPLGLIKRNLLIAEREIMKIQKKIIIKYTVCGLISFIIASLITRLAFSGPTTTTVSVAMMVGIFVAMFMLANKELNYQAKSKIIKKNSNNHNEGNSADSVPSPADL